MSGVPAVRRLTALGVALAAGVAAFAATAAAAPVTPLRIASFALAPDGTFSPGDRLRIDARVRNTGKVTIRTGRLDLYLRRTASTAPAGAANATGRVPGVRGGTLVRAHAQVTLTRAMHGRLRFVACVRSAGRARACRAVRGSITVR